MPPSAAGLSWSSLSAKMNALGRLLTAHPFNPPLLVPLVEGIADAGAIDLALVNGPGLRWAVASAHMIYHLGGGEGGMVQYLKHLSPSQESRCADLGSPTLTSEVCAILIYGVEAEAKGESLKDLEQARDAGLMSILAARNGLKKY